MAIKLKLKLFKNPLWLAKIQVPYIGVLGPKKKLERMLFDVENEGIEITDERIEKIYGPVGLDIGAETAEQIALSILSEIGAVLNGRKGGFLRERKEAIHTPIKA